MKTPFLVALASVLFISSASAAPSWKPLVVNRQSAVLLAKRDFAGLDAFAEQIKKKGFDICQDDTELGAFYGGLSMANRESEEAWSERLKVLQAWLEKFPNSISARIAIADWHIDHAWRARGDGFANTITPQGSQTMESDAAKAASLLEAIPKETVIDDPIYYHIWLKICLLQGRPKDEMFAYLNKGIALAREYQPLYTAAGAYLMERWYGETDEREQWMKTWADTFPPEKGDVFYAYMLVDDSHYYGTELFKKPVDYQRAKLGLQKRLAQDDPNWIEDENNLCHLAIFKRDTGDLRKMLLDLEGNDGHVLQFGKTQEERDAYYQSLRKFYGVAAAVRNEIATERDGDLVNAEKRLLAMTSHPLDYRPLAEFYERQGMEEKALAMTVQREFRTLKEMEAADLATADLDLLVDLGHLYPMLGKWDRAEEVAKRFEQQRQTNMIGKNILLLCAIHHGDAEGTQAILDKIVSIKTNRPIYEAVQSVLKGEQTWEQASHSEVLKKRDPYLSQGITAIVLYYIARKDKGTARAVIEQSLPNCEDDAIRLLLQSLLFGSVGRSLDLLAPAFAFDVHDLKIIAASWGAGDKQADVTDRIKEIIEHPELDFQADPESLKSEPVFGVKKTLVINFEWKNKPYVLTTPEGGTIGIRPIKTYLRKNVN